MEKNLTEARAKDSLRAFGKLTTIDDGEPRIVSDPPLIVPIEELTGMQVRRVRAGSERRLPAHAAGADRRQLLERFRYVHATREVVGVVSVGTHAWIALMLANDNYDPAFLESRRRRPRYSSRSWARASTQTTASASSRAQGAAAER